MLSFIKVRDIFTFRHKNKGHILEGIGFSFLVKDLSLVSSHAFHLSYISIVSKYCF